MTRAEQYRDKADECERMALAAKDIDAKRALEGLVVQWREMAGWVDYPRRNRGKVGTGAKHYFNFG
jgi:hypothetical protein